MRFIYLYNQLIRLLDNFGFNCLLLFIRIWMARIFFYSGLAKISSWPSTIYLFKEEYKVPIIPPELAAYLATSVELSCSVLLVVGLMTRISAIPMLVMTAVIEFTYLDMNEHTYWAILLGVLILNGPGKLSIDYLICRHTLYLIPAKAGI